MINIIVNNFHQRFYRLENKTLNNVYDFGFVQNQRGYYIFLDCIFDFNLCIYLYYNIFIFEIFSKLE
jgi:hypothetical protein